MRSNYQETRPECRIGSFHASGNQKKIDCFNVNGYCDNCKTVFEAMGCYYHFCPCQETRPSLSDEDIERGNKGREMDDLRRKYIRKNVTKSKRCGNVSVGKISKRTKELIIISDPTFPTIDLSLLIFYWEKRDGSFYGYIQCDLVVPDELKEKFSNFPPISKNTEVGRNDIGEYLQSMPLKKIFLSIPSEC